MKIIDVATEDYKKSIDTTIAIDLDVTDAVVNILKEVRTQKNQAVIDYTLQFDHVQLKSLEVTPDEIQEAYEKIDERYLEIIGQAIDNIKTFHRFQTETGFEFETSKQSTMGMKITPLQRVGLYIPGGKAAYPSSVLMNAIPAIIAGVQEIVLVTPPLSTGKVNPYILVAADQLGINEIYKIGGAQAIGALAYGTETIKPVDKIVGPGNQYVAEAKRQVFGICDIDMIAGPSEIAVIADEEAKANYIARDLLSQAEHDEQARCYLITTSQMIIDQTLKALKRFINTSQRKDILKQSIENNLCIFKAENIDQMIEISNFIAPEHLELLVEKPKELLDQIQNAGSIFIGEYSPEPVGDYFAGPNHTLPTNGTAKFSSPLGVYDFVKRSSYIQYSAEDFLTNAKSIVEFAELEGLYEHANSIKERLK
jgi:histidinol dehydrogenase